MNRLYFGDNLQFWGTILLPLGMVVTAFAGQQTITEDGISITYDRSMFSKVEIYEAKAKPALENPSWGSGVRKCDAPSQINPFAMAARDFAAHKQTEML